MIVFVGLENVEDIAVIVHQKSCCWRSMDAEIVYLIYLLKSFILAYINNKLELKCLKLASIRTNKV